MNNSIGIDAGGSLIKIAYEEKNRMHFRKHSIHEANAAIGWLRMISLNKTITLTGGRAGRFKAEYFPEAKIVDEFTAACKGAKYLMMEEGRTIHEKFLLINIGTGTSWFTIEDEHYDRVLGSGVGGGTFMGIGKILAESNDFSKLVNMSQKGKRGNVDCWLKISMILKNHRFQVI